MFDELRDREPPQPDMGKLQAVTARAKQLRIRRYAAMGVACAVLFAAGAGAVVAVNGRDSELAPSETNPPITTTIESTFPGTTIPPGSTTPGTTVPATTAMPATTRPTTTVSLVSATAAPTTSPPTTISATATPTPPATTCSGPTSGLLAVRDGEILKVALDGSIDSIGVYADPGHAEVLRRVMQSDDGTIWLEVDNPESGERAVGTYTTAKAGRPDRFTPLRSGEVRLEAVGSLNGESVAAVIDDSNPDNLETYGTFEIIDVAGNTVAPTPNRPNNRVLSVTISTDVIAVAESSDVSERLTYYDAGGALLTRYDPNTNGTPDYPADDPIQYGLPPRTINPIQLGRGEVAWLEGPEQQFGAERVGDWQLVIADQKTGAERVRVQIGGIDEEFRSADTDGRWFVVNLGDHEEGQLESPPTRSVIIDLSAPEPTPLDVCDGFTDVALTRP